MTEYMYIFVAKLSYKRRIITGTCTDSVKLIVFVFSKKHFHEIQPRKIYTGTAVYFYAQSVGLLYSLQLIADCMSPKANTIPNIPVLYMQHHELKHDGRSLLPMSYMIVQIFHSFNFEVGFLTIIISFQIKDLQMKKLPRSNNHTDKEHQDSKHRRQIKALILYPANYFCFNVQAVIIGFKI